MEFLSAEGLVTAMYDLGLQLFVGDDGVVHGKMRRGGKLPLEAWKLVDQSQLSVRLMLWLPKSMNRWSDAWCRTKGCRKG